MSWYANPIVRKHRGLSLKHRGLSLIESMIGLAILAMMISISLPNVSEWQAKALIKNQQNGIFSLFQAGRGLAISQAQAVTVCGSRDAMVCRDADWRFGAVAFNDRNRNGAVDDGDKVITVLEFDPERATVSSSRKKTVFLPDGTSAGSNQTVRICGLNSAKENNGLGASVVISNSGRVRFGPANCG